jgi:hypothetical protein
MVRRRRISGAGGAFYYCPIVTAMTRFREPPWPQACPPPSPLFRPGQHAIGRVQGRLPDAEPPSQVTASTGAIHASAGEPTLRPQTRCLPAHYDADRGSLWFSSYGTFTTATATDPSRIGEPFTLTPAIASTSCIASAGRSWRVTVGRLA